MAEETTKVKVMAEEENRKTPSPDSAVPHKAVAAVARKAGGAPRKAAAKQSVYGKQLFEKQKAKEIYGMRERQFSNYVAEASKRTGDTSKFLMSYLESRLDNVVYRMGVGKTRAAARQIVNHGHIMINGKKTNIPSYRVSVGDEIRVKEKAANSPLYDKLGERMAKLEPPAWLGLDPKKLAAKVLNTPTIDDPGFDAKLIIEFYSR